MCTDIYGHIYHIYHIYHISFLRQKRIRATCETWPHKRKIFHLKSKRRLKSCKIPPAKCCSHHHSQGPPQESICAAAKGPQVTQQEPPASQKSPVTPVEAAARGEWGLQPSPRQPCSHSHRAEPWHNSQTPHPWSWAGSRGLILRVCKRTCTLSFLMVLLSHTWTASIFSLTSWWRRPNEAMQCLKKTAVLLWSWISLFQSHNIRFLRHQFPMLIVQIWELLINNKNQINTSYQIPYEWI